MPFVPPQHFIILETEYWWVNHRVDTPYPGYLMIGAKAGNGKCLSALPPSAQQELGPLLARCDKALRENLGAVRTYEGRYGHTPGHSVHYHVIPVYEWTIAAYLQDVRFRAIQQFCADPNENPSNFDAGDMMLFIWRSFAEPGKTPDPVFGPSVDQVVAKLRELLRDPIGLQASVRQP